MAKSVAFLGNSLDNIKTFPADAQGVVGYQLHRVQEGLNPQNWKPMPSIGAGVQEIKVSMKGQAFRTIYIASFKDAVYVLHAFEKKSNKTAKSDVDLAKRRLRDLKAET